jgi:hypothetical protein
MKIFGFDFNKQKPITPIQVEKNNSVDDGLYSFSLGAQTDLPVITENRNHEWVDYGIDNLYPEYLKDMYNTSPTHQAIVKTKAQMVIGEGWEINETYLDEADKVKIYQILLQIEKDGYELSLDYQIFGAMALEVIWSLDHTRIVEVNRIDPSKLRSGKFEDGKVEEWYYKRDWSDRREDEVCIYSFNRGDLENHRQLLYIPGQKVSNEYYGEPSYLGAMDWITLESQVGLYYKSLIENGFNPSVLVKFYRKPASQEERDDVVNGLKRSFGGVKRAGKAMVIFSDGKELAPDVTPVDVQNVDKQFVVISDQITQKILTGERATTPELFGLSIPGQLGSGDFETKVKCFNKYVIQPDQKVFENMVNGLLLANGYKVDFRLKPMVI